MSRKDATKKTAHVQVCAIGASAGGLTALQQFLRNVAPDLGLAFVVVTHLSPDHPSALAEILAACTPMPVQSVPDGALLRPAHVYVAPPDHALLVDGNKLAAQPFDGPRGQRSPINQLFLSLAGQRSDGIAIILSGEGSDGVAGARAVKEAGGLVLTQDPAEAEHGAMPQAAIDTGIVDVTAPVATLAGRISEIVETRSITEKPRDGDAMREIMTALHRRVGHDFSHYKLPTLLRRIGRRMQLTGSASLVDYAKLVRSSDEEVRALFADLLISVTGFFRDPKAFEALRRDVITPIFDRLDDTGAHEIRAWSVGCATGEEAYSLAILLIEEAERRQINVPIQVFATDIDEAALVKARTGAYGQEIEAVVGAERLQRFFTRVHDRWQVRQNLRDMVLFARHSVLKDPPFIHLDVALCRNLLIYLDRHMQRQVLGMLRYALDARGFLMLGTAETVDTVPEMFRVIDRDARLYAAQGGPDRPVILSAEIDVPQPAAALTTQAQAMRGTGALHLAALEKAAPPSALVGADQRVLHLSPTAGRFLAPPGGPLAVDLPTLARPELRLDLKVALHRALDDGQPTLTMPTRTAFNGTRRRVLMQVMPDPEAEPAAPRALVFFIDGGPVDEDGDDAGGDMQPDETRRLHDELRAAQDRLAAGRGEHETALQELRAANEELQSVNEEYRSTSEELETSKEELQSMNEELQTLNAELKSKLEAVTVANNDLSNLIASTDYGTLVLDADLKIRMFTPRLTEVFHLASADVGRPITDFAHTLVGPGIVEDARRILRDLAPIERDARTVDGRWLTVRLRPYRTVEDRIEGVVVTFVDVTTVREATERLSVSEERFSSLVEATADAVFQMSPDWTELRVLDGSNFLASTQEPQKDWLARFIPETEQAKLLTAVHEAITRKGLFELEYRVIRVDGTVGWILTRAAPILDENNAIREWFGVASDVTARRESTERLQEARDMLALATEAAELGRVLWDPQTWKAEWDRRALEIMGLDAAETRPEDWLTRVHPEDRAQVEERLSKPAANGRPFNLAFRVRDRDGSVRHVQSAGVIVAATDGRAQRGTALLRDVTERRQTEEAQRLMMGELNHRMKNMLTVVLSIAARTRAESASLDDYADAFEERLHALARSHEALTRKGWKGADLADLLRNTVALFDSGRSERVSISAVPVELGASAAVTFSLALHELCTNALKYGALSIDAGNVDIGWWIEDGPTGRRFVFEWREAGGPPVSPRRRRGFGSDLLEEGLPGELDGTARLAFESGGVRYRLEAPISAELHDG